MHELLKLKTLSNQKKKKKIQIRYSFNFLRKFRDYQFCSNRYSNDFVSATFHGFTQNSQNLQNLFLAKTYVFKVVRKQLILYKLLSILSANYNIIERDEQKKYLIVFVQEVSTHKMRFKRSNFQLKTQMLEIVTPVN